MADAAQQRAAGEGPLEFAVKVSQGEFTTEFELPGAVDVGSGEQITVTRQFEPLVRPGFWQEQPGIVVWAQTLAPGQTARFSADDLISHPKDLIVSDRR